MIACARVVVGALALAGCSGEPSTWTVKEESVDGVRPRMTFAQVHERWEEVASFNPGTGSGASLGVSAACVDERPVLTGFWSFSTDDRDAELFFAWFLDRVRTDEGIRIGSTLEQLRSSYGSRLERVEDDDDLESWEMPPFAVFKVVPRRPPPRDVLLFAVSRRSTVEAIGLARGGESFSARDGINQFFGGTC